MGAICVKNQTVYISVLLSLSLSVCVCVYVYVCTCGGDCRCAGDDRLSVTSVDDDSPRCAFNGTSTEWPAWSISSKHVASSGAVVVVVVVVDVVIVFKEPAPTATVMIDSLECKSGYHVPALVILGDTFCINKLTPTD